MRRQAERKPTALEFILARARVARELVRGKEILPEDALALTVWPTDDLTQAELCVPAGTIVSRGTLARLNL